MLNQVSIVLVLTLLNPFVVRMPNCNRFWVNETWIFAGQAGNHWWVDVAYWHVFWKHFELVQVPRYLVYLCRLHVNLEILRWKFALFIWSITVSRDYIFGGIGDFRLRNSINLLLTSFSFTLLQSAYLLNIGHAWEINLIIKFLRIHVRYLGALILFACKLVKSLLTLENM